MQKVFRVFILLDFVLGCLSGLIGVALWEKEKAEGSWMLAAHMPWYPVVELAGLLTSATALATSGVTFGLPDLGGGRLRVHFAVCLWLIIYGAPTAVCPRFYPTTLRDLMENFFFLISLPTFLLGVRGWPCLLVAVMSCAGSLVHSPVSLLMVKICFSSVCATFTRYLRDQRLVVCIMALPIASYNLGHQTGLWILYEKASYLVFVNLLLGCVMVYTNLLLRRRHRYLPPGLKKAKFVRLGYLRKMLKTGQRIRRCQELPDEAFGNPMKALHLVIVSHRWLDPITSDIVSEAHPQGLKLKCLVQRLESKFSPQQFCRWAGKWSLLEHLHATCCVGGWDVVVFFDFMSIPQRGLTPEGEVIPRTPDETLVFTEALPNMGTLYSLFPVLTLTDTPEGDTDHAYMESGWCVCEFTIALLGKQLRRYSEEMLSDFERRESFSSFRAMSESDAMSFTEIMSDKLDSLHFLHQTDRDVAQGIVKAFVGKRLLYDLIWEGDMEGVGHVLSTLAEDDLQPTLSEPVDLRLNTLLHVAVQAQQPKAVELLLSHGAPRNAKNLLGDKPTEWLAFPRMNEAARAVRAGKGLELLPTIIDIVERREGIRRKSGREFSMTLRAAGTRRQMARDFSNMSGSSNFSLGLRRSSSREFARASSGRTMSIASERGGHSGTAIRPPPSTVGKVAGDLEHGVVGTSMDSSSPHSTIAEEPPPPYANEFCRLGKHCQQDIDEGETRTSHTRAVRTLKKADLIIDSSEVGPSEEEPHSKGWMWKVWNNGPSSLFACSNCAPKANAQL